MSQKTLGKQRKEIDADKERKNGSHLSFNGLLSSVQTCGIPQQGGVDWCIDMTDQIDTRLVR